MCSVWRTINKNICMQCSILYYLSQVSKTIKPKITQIAGCSNWIQKFLNLIHPKQNYVYNFHIRINLGKGGVLLTVWTLKLPSWRDCTFLFCNPWYPVDPNQWCASEWCVGYVLGNDMFWLQFYSHCCCTLAGWHSTTLHKLTAAVKGALHGVRCRGYLFRC